MTSTPVYVHKRRQAKPCARGGKGCEPLCRLDGDVEITRPEQLTSFILVEVSTRVYGVL